MIEKVEIITNMQPQTELEKSILRVFNGVATKLNEVIDVVNGVLAAQEQYATIYNEDIVPMLTPQNEEPSYKNRNLEALALAVNTFSSEIIEQINQRNNNE